jgi:hypothetical protein
VTHERREGAEGSSAWRGKLEEKGPVFFIGARSGRARGGDRRWRQQRRVEGAGGKSRWDSERRVAENKGDRDPDEWARGNLKIQYEFQI